ncbi:MAG: phage holin family protein [Mogibacterium sp.]|nr:phage holin family protein [Mogibacterium sp.]
MNINFENYLIPIITVGCLCIGFVLKKWMPADDKWIPTILLVLGAISGAILFGVDYEGIVKGMLSGLASVGLHQAFHQFIKVDTLGEMTDEEGAYWIATDEELQEELKEYEDE